jgi:hypothetical protein
MGAVDLVDLAVEANLLDKDDRAKAVRVGKLCKRYEGMKMQDGVRIFSVVRDDKKVNNTISWRLTVTFDEPEDPEISDEPAENAAEALDETNQKPNENSPSPSPEAGSESIGPITPGIAVGGEGGGTSQAPPRAPPGEVPKGGAP